MSSSAQLAATVVAGGRFLVGISTLLAPLRASRLLYAPLHPNDGFVGRLFGSRDLVLSLALWYGQGQAKESVAGTKHNAQYLRWALTLGILVDAIDTISGLVEFGQGRLSNEGVLLGSGGAALLAILGYVGLGST